MGKTSPKPARHSQAAINNRALEVYFKRFEHLPHEMGVSSRQAARYHAECLQRAEEEMGPPIDFVSGSVIVQAVVSPEVQALIDRMAARKPSALERAKHAISR